MTERRHGAPSPVDLATFFGDDPELALVTADQEDYRNAHPCECEALCTCNNEED